MLSTNIGFAIRRCPWYFFSNATLNTGSTFIPSGNSNLAALRLTIFSTFKGPTYCSRNLPGLSFSFRCFVDNSTSSPGLMSDFLRTLSARFLLFSACFVSRSWTSVHSLRRLARKSSTAGIYTGRTARSIGRRNLRPCTIS